MQRRQRPTNETSNLNAVSPPVTNGTFFRTPDTPRGIPETPRSMLRSEITLNDEQEIDYLVQFQRAQMNPFDKWAKHGKPPIKFFLHILLVFLTTMQVVMYSDNTLSYMRASYGTWNHCVTGSNDMTASPSYLYTIDDTLNHMNQTVQNFYSLVETSVGRYFWMKDGSGQLEPIEMSVWAYDTDARKCPLGTKTQATDCHITKSKYTCTQDNPFGGVALNNTRQFFDTLYKFELQFRIKNVAILEARSLCYVWDIVSLYDFRTRGGRIQASWKASRIVCAETQTYWYSSPLESQLLLAGGVCVVSVLALFLTFKAIFASLGLYLSSKRRFHQTARSYWDALPIKKKFMVLSGFFDMWNVTVIVGDTCNLSAAVLNIMMGVGEVPDTLVFRFLTGFGCMLTWISLLKYLEYNEKSYALILALKQGTPGVVRFAVGAAPVFVGYALFGVVFFGADTNKFQDLDYACATLFSLLNGDSVLDIFNALYDTSAFISRVYLYTFVGLFIFAVFNIFVAIIEEAFHAAKGSKDADSDHECTPKLDTPTLISDSRFKAAVDEAVIRAQRQLLEQLQEVLDGQGTSSTNNSTAVADATTTITQQKQ
eukprot:c11928_g1_i1.p1 GENE.c11928_g1_i1~~c11928_g1_i1.p1  ORF type:complete len:597 (-),score=143.13 c11928_g1_i1:87-1877(-)